MKVTGWTYYEDPDYIDLQADRTELFINEVTNKVSTPMPNLKQKESMPEDQFLELCKKHNKEFTILADNFQKSHKNLDRYISKCYNCVIDELREKGYKFTGETHQNYDNGVPIIDNRFKVCCSQRTWGGLVYESTHGNDLNPNGYLDWAWYIDGIEEILPKE